MIQPPQPLQVPTVAVQPSAAYPLPYAANPMPPSIAEANMSSSMPMPSTMATAPSISTSQSNLYPEAPPPYSLYASNPTLGALGFASDGLSSQQSRPRFPSAPPGDSEKVSIDITKM